MTDRATNQSGGCQCGSVRYVLKGDPLEVYVCHCAECRHQSASAFGISVIVRSKDIELVQGDLKLWSRPADSGGTVHCFFCPSCGTRLWHGDPETEDTVSVKGGSLDSPVDLTNAFHIWTSRALPGVAIPGHARNCPEEPD